MIWATIAIVVVAIWAVGLAVLIDSARHPGPDHPTSDHPTSDERWSGDPT